MTNKTFGFNYQKLVLVISITALAVMGFNGCGGDEEPKTVTVKEFITVENSLFAGQKDVANLTVSGDNKHVYLTMDANKSLYHGDASDLTQAWTPIKLKTGLDGRAGRAKLVDTHDVTNISAAADGALVSVRGRYAEDTGVFYMVGKGQKQAAWARRDVGLDMNAQITKGLIVGVIVKKDGNDIPYIWGQDAGNHYIAVTKGDLKPAKMVDVVRRETTEFSTEPKLISGGDYLFAVTREGVTTMPKADIGKAKNFPDVVAGSPANANGVVGSEKFRMEPTIANNNVTSLQVHDDKLYIALNSGGDHTGGVAVYHIKATGAKPEVKNPDSSWNRIGVSKLLKDSQGTIWAVTADDIFEAKADGSRGASYFDSPAMALADITNGKPGFKNRDSFPNIKPGLIDDAAFVGDELIVASKKKGGLLVISGKEKIIPVK